MFNETCCFYINNTGIVEKSLEVLKKNIDIIQRAKERAYTSGSWLSTLLSCLYPSLKALLLPLITPFFILLLFLLLGPCLIKLLINCIRRTIEVTEAETTKAILLLRGYHPLHHNPAQEEEVPLP